MTGRAIGKADTVRFYHPDHQKSRTGVVVIPPQGPQKRLLVIFGRGTELAELHLTVRYPSQAATAIDLYKTTYFHVSSVVFVTATKAEYVGHCPPEVFRDLVPIALAGVRRARTIT